MEEFHNANESHENHDAHSILVNPQKLSQGLTRTFEGISIIFESLGSKLAVLDVTDLAGRVTEKTATAKQGTTESAETVEKTEQSAQSKQAKISEQTQPPEPTESSESSEESSEPAKSSITIDDITKVVVEKLKQDRENDNKIGTIVHSYGVSAISQIPESKYEAFLAEIASL